MSRWRECDVKGMEAVTAQVLHCMRQWCTLAGKQVQEKRRGCCARLRAGMGVRDLRCGVELRSVPGCDAALVLLALGLRETCPSSTWGPAAGTGAQGVLGERGLGAPKPSFLEGIMGACVAGAGAGCGKGFGAL